MITPCLTIASRDHVQSACGRSRGMTVFPVNSDIKKHLVQSTRETASLPPLRETWGSDMIFRELTMRSEYRRFHGRDGPPAVGKWDSILRSA